MKKETWFCITFLSSSSSLHAYRAGNLSLDMCECVFIVCACGMMYTRVGFSLLIAAPASDSYEKARTSLGSSNTTRHDILSRI